MDFNTLEFPLFCSTVQARFVSSFAAAEMSTLRPRKSIGEIVSFQNDLKAIFDLYNNQQAPALENDNSFYELYNKVTAENTAFMHLEPADYLIIRQFILQLVSLKTWLDTKKTALTRLDGVISRLQPDGALADLIGRTFENDGEIKDSATGELRSIRTRIREVKRRVQNILQSTFNKSNSDKFIQEQIVVLRHGRYTLPCKTNFSQYMEGIIHDRSASGQTVYVEPTSCVPLNNELQESIIAESEEIARILANLLAYFKSTLDTLKLTVQSYTYLALLIEIRSFYSKFDYVFPEFDDEIVFKDVHHPLLVINKGAKSAENMSGSVPLDLSLAKGQNLIVVSGPNTGGKTASLKSVGLNHMIGMSGLPLIGRKASLVYFDDIRADIGDNQSLVMDLSTFSSHMTNICNIITGVKGCSLLLFDELGTGTDPREGAALAVAVLEYARKAGSKVMVTTHFSEMKSYAFERKDAKMYAVDFDYDTFTPTYRLLEGVAGRSDPIIIADRLGFPKTITDEARDRVDAIKSQNEAVLEEINLMKAEAEHTKRVLIEREKELAERESKFNDANSQLKEKLSKKELELLEDTLALLQRGKRLADERLKDKPENIKEDIVKVSEKIKEIKSKQKPVKDIQIGDLIFLDKYSKIAKIISLDNNYAHVDLEGIKVRISRQDLVGKKVNDTKPKKVKVSSQDKSQSRSELVLVGKRVEEALDILDKYIDQAQLTGYDKVYIIHGRGSGQLRNAIHEYFRSTKRVKHFSIASAEEGGNAVTVVEL